MAQSQARTTTAEDNKGAKLFHLDLSRLPPVYVLATNLSIDEQHEVEDALSARGAPVTYDINEAKVILGNISRAQRARLELKWKDVEVEEVPKLSTKERKIISSVSESEPIQKKRKIANNEQVEHTNRAAIGEKSDAAFENAQQVVASRNPITHLSTSELPSSPLLDSPRDKFEGLSSCPLLPDLGPDDVMIVRLGWLNAAIKTDKFLPLDSEIVLYARKLKDRVLEKPLDIDPSPITVGSIKHTKLDHTNEDSLRTSSGSIVERAKTDRQAKPAYSRYFRRDRVAEAAKHDIIGKSFSSSSQPTRPIQLEHQVTSEDNDSQNSKPLSMPDWVLQNKIYSCERSTPPDPPNSEFIELLKMIRLARELTLDYIGVRAYSTSIASLSAYPYPLKSSREVIALPGCDAKIAQLFHEYKTTSQLQAVLDINADTALTSLRSFFDIWGVGAITAREFYYDRGWRDLDDIIEYGWNALSRVQQIGLKYYDEFKEALSRSQVEEIAATITYHAAIVTDSNIQTAIVGGYRRGKAESNDVDIILSHPDESQTHNLVTKVVDSLEKDGWITHTLTLNLTTTNRGQATLPINPGSVGRGFDSLDKALVVWQPPEWPTKTSDLAADPKCKNPNTHRRVDIIISPWRTVGCAVAGWTSGTTFQRDLRRYCKYKKRWKFDSSGVRERGTGAWVDLEGYRDVKTRCKTWQEAEKRVFQGLGLEWREPWERCTG